MNTPDIDFVVGPSGRAERILDREKITTAADFVASADGVTTSTKTEGTKPSNEPAEEVDANQQKSAQERTADEARKAEEAAAKTHHKAAEEKTEKQPTKNIKPATKKENDTSSAGVAIFGFAVGLVLFAIEDGFASFYTAAMGSDKLKTHTAELPPLIQGTAKPIPAENYRAVFESTQGKCRGPNIDTGIKRSESLSNVFAAHKNQEIELKPYKEDPTAFNDETGAYTLKYEKITADAKGITTLSGTWKSRAFDDTATTTTNKKYAAYMHGRWAYPCSGTFVLK